MAQQKHADQLAAGRKAYLYLESPCNPHGYVLDLPAICRSAHEAGLRVIVDATVGTPFLCQPLQRPDPTERPDFVIHSYTKDLSGTGSVIAGVVIARNADMFIPKGESADGVAWNETMFWNVYYVKGAFLNADAAFEVIQGMRTLELRMLAKCINAQILARFLNSHASIQVHCNALEQDANSPLREKLHYLGLPAPLFTIDMPAVPRESFARFFDALAPAFDHMISLGQANTIVSCPALTTHSELDAQALAESGITPTTIRFAVGDEDPKDLMAHFLAAAQLTLDEAVPGFSSGFMHAGEVDALVAACYLETHRKYIEAKPRFAEKME
jgi:cystathionine beta-lyase/cystathionine gamma-synthase